MDDTSVAYKEGRYKKSMHAQMRQCMDFSNV